MSDDTTKLAIAIAALEQIAREPGTCNESDGDTTCERPAVYFEKDGGAWGGVNKCCDLPEHVELHRYVIEKAKSKGSHRGTQAPIELSSSCKAAREALAKIAAVQST